MYGVQVAPEALAAADEIELLDCALCLGTGLICEGDGDVVCPHAERDPWGAR